MRKIFSSPEFKQITIDEVEDALKEPGEMQSIKMSAAEVHAVTRLPGSATMQRWERVRTPEKPKAKKLPRSIWTITYVEDDRPDGVRRSHLRIERRGRTDVLVIYSKEGAPPQIGGLLERMELPKRGVAVIWSDKDATSESVGGGYSREAMPREWLGFQNLNPGEPWTGDQS
jgi:hypothetical protein